MYPYGGFIDRALQKPIFPWSCKRDFQGILRHFSGTRKLKVLLDGYSIHGEQSKVMVRWQSLLTIAGVFERVAVYRLSCAKILILIDIFSLLLNNPW